MTYCHKAQELAERWEEGMTSLHQSGFQIMAYGVTKLGFEAIIQPPQGGSVEDALRKLRDRGFASVKQQRALSSDTDATTAMNALEAGILSGFEDVSSAAPGALGATGPNASRERPAYHLRNLAGFELPFVAPHRICRPKQHP